MEVGKKWQNYISDIKSCDHILVIIRRVHLMSRQTSATVASRASQICNTGAAETRQDAMWACETFAGVTQPRARNYEHPFV